MRLIPKVDYKVTLMNDEVWFSNSTWGKIGRTTYRQDYHAELTGVRWSKNGEYLYSAKLNKYLHRYIMEKWYGTDVMERMTNEGYVIDHLNNEGFDCTLSNLAFLHGDENKAKGLTLDKEIPHLRPHTALTIYKDFANGTYQITLGFNARVAEYRDGWLYPLASIKLLYDLAYEQVLLEARNILLAFKIEGHLNPKKLRFRDKRVQYAIPFAPQKHEEGAAIVHRDGEAYLVLNEHTRIHSIGPDLGWNPPSPLST